MCLRLILLALCLYVPATASSQGEVTDAEKLEDALCALRAMEAECRALQERAEVQDDPKAKAALDAYYESYVEFYNHQQNLRDHAIAALKWQLRSAYGLTVLVFFVVGLGIYLSIIEVRTALKRRGEVGHDLLAQDTQSTAQEKIQLTLSLQKLQVTSAVTGVVILVLSLAFLYLFVKEVFEINPQDFSAHAIPAALSEEMQADVAGDDEAEPTSPATGSP